MVGNRLQLSWEWGLAMVGNRLQLSWECVPVQLGMDISLVGNGFQLWLVMGLLLSWEWVAAQLATQLGMGSSSLHFLTRGRCSFVLL